MSAQAWGTVGGFSWIRARTHLGAGAAWRGVAVAQKCGGNTRVGAERGQGTGADARQPRHGLQHHPRGPATDYTSRGSSASRRPSPRKVKARVIEAMARAAIRADRIGGPVVRLPPA